MAPADAGAKFHHAREWPLRRAAVWLPVQRAAGAARSGCCAAAGSVSARASGDGSASPRAAGAAVRLCGGCDASRPSARPSGAFLPAVGLPCQRSPGSAARADVGAWHATTSAWPWCTSAVRIRSPTAIRVGAGACRPSWPAAWRRGRRLPTAPVPGADPATRPRPRTGSPADVASASAAAAPWRRTNAGANIPAAAAISPAAAAPSVEAAWFRHWFRRSCPGHGHLR